jgi:predicted SnoaL-like aldol condensation-catalyzing enzyme
MQEVTMQQFSPQQNKTIVIEAFETLFNLRDTEKAERFWSPDYIQHSALVPPGRDGLFATIKNAPGMRYEHQLAVAEGDYVMIHGRFTHLGEAANWIVVDICRLQNGVLVEHWDVIQDEVGQAASAGGYPMFGRAFPREVSSPETMAGQVASGGA